MNHSLRGVGAVPRPGGGLEGEDAGKFSEGKTMAQQTIIELAKRLQEEQSKYTYFILTAAGAAMALAINQTGSISMEWPQLFLATAAALWALSFFLGCRRLHVVDMGTSMNVQALILGQDMSAPDAQKEFGKISEKVTTLYEWQFRSLVYGGLFYIAWHVIEMYLRTP